VGVGGAVEEVGLHLTVVGDEEWCSICYNLLSWSFAPSV